MNRTNENTNSTDEDFDPFAPPERKMEPLEVYRGQRNHVVIKQTTMVDEALILLHPTQVPILIQWLQEVLVEIQSHCGEPKGDKSAAAPPAPQPLALPPPPRRKDTSGSR